MGLKKVGENVFLLPLAPIHQEKVLPQGIKVENQTDWITYSRVDISEVLGGKGKNSTFSSLLKELIKLQQFPESTAG